MLHFQIFLSVLYGFGSTQLIVLRASHHFAYGYRRQAALTRLSVFLHRVSKSALEAFTAGRMYSSQALLEISVFAPFLITTIKPWDVGRFPPM